MSGKQQVPSRVLKMLRIGFFFWGGYLTRKSIWITLIKRTLTGDPKLENYLCTNYQGAPLPILLAPIFLQPAVELGRQFHPHPTA